MDHTIGFGDQEITVDAREWADKVHQLFFEEVVHAALAGVDDLRELLDQVVQDTRVNEYLHEVYKEDVMERFRQEQERSQGG